MGKSLENYDLFIGAGVEPDLGSRDVQGWDMEV